MQVGDGKDLTDTDFCLVQRSFEQAIAGGASNLNAQDMLDNLEAFSTTGTINAAMDLGNREQEPAEQPKAYTGLDAIYHRQYVYDADGTLSGMLLRQFFGIGKGRFVSVEQMNALWTHEFVAAGELDPVLLSPSHEGTGRLLVPKVKLTAEHATSQKVTAAEKRAYRLQALVIQAEAIIAAEVKREQRRSKVPSFLCPFSQNGSDALGGCRHRAFLLKGRCDAHSRTCIWNPQHEFEVTRRETLAADQPELSATQLDAELAVEWVGLSLEQRQDHEERHAETLASGKVKAKVRFAAAPVTVATRVLHGRVKVSLLAHGTPISLKLKVLRPPKPKVQYGLNKFKTRRLSTPSEVQALRMETIDVRLVGADLTLSRFSGPLSTAGPNLQHYVSLALNTFADRRRPPESLPRGWALRPPRTHRRHTDAQRAFLKDVYERSMHGGARVGEKAAESLMKQKFNQAEGEYARALRLSRAKIKAWFSSEKARRRKAVVQAGAAEELSKVQKETADTGGSGAASSGGSGDGNGSAASSSGTAAAHSDVGGGRGGGRGEGRGGGTGGGRGRGRGGGRGGGRGPGVSVMRAEAKSLGWGVEAKAAKGTAAVATVLEQVCKLVHKLVSL